MKKPPDKDRRKHARYSLDASVHYKVRSLPSPRKMIQLLDTMRRAKGKDVSKEGMRFTSTQLLLPGTVIELAAPPSEHLKSRKLKARVVWIREVAPDKYQVGVKFA
jgi:hypothetical protein